MSKDLCCFESCENVLDEMQVQFSDDETLVDFSVCEECADLILNDNSPKTDKFRLKGFCGCGNRFRNADDQRLGVCGDCR